MGLHNFAPAAARPDRNFKLLLSDLFSKFLQSFSMSVCTKLAVDEDWSFPASKFMFGLVWFGWCGLV